MVGIGKAQVQGLHHFQLHVGADDEAVDHIVLGVRGVCRIVRLVQQPAAGYPVVTDEEPAGLVGQLAVLQHPGLPQLGQDDGVVLQAPGEELVEVAAGDHVIALLILGFDEVSELPGLGDLALAAVIGLQVQVHQHQLLLAPLDGQVAHQQAALQIHDPQRPVEGAGEGDPLRRVDPEIGFGQQTAVDLSDGVIEDGLGIGHKGADVVRRVVAVAGGQAHGLIGTVGAVAIHVHLLQQHHVVIAALQRLLDPPQIAAHRGFISGTDGLSAVHDEILLRTQSRIADVPAQQIQRGLGQQRGFGLVADGLQLLNGIGDVFRHAEPAHQACQTQQDHQHDDQQCFAEILHKKSS